MRNIFFSIIVPCYNVQDYLTECIESILAQTYQNFEVIVVDDGSTDNTPELCDRFSVLDKRIHTFHTKNGGLSAARNYGIERANGDYLVFVDGDDFILKEALSNFAECFHNANPDVLLTRLTECYEDGEIVTRDEGMEAFFKDGVSFEKALIWEMRKSKNSWPAPKKIVSRNFVEKYHLRFLEGFLHEDINWSSKVMIYAKTFEVYFAPWYYHRKQRSGSITNIVSSKRVTDVIEITSMLINSKELQSISEEGRKLIINRLMCSVYPILVLYRQLSSDEKKNVINCCTNNKNIFKTAPNLKYRFFSLASRVFGFRLSFNILGRFGDKL